MQCSPIRVLEYQVAVIGRGIIVKYSGPQFFKASDGVSLSSIGGPQLLWRMACWISQATVPCLSGIFFKLNFHFFSGPLRTIFLLVSYLFSLYFIADPSDAKTRAKSCIFYGVTQGMKGNPLALFCTVRQARRG